MSLLTLVTIVHLVMAFLLILFVLLQDSKGGAMGILGGGGSSDTLFGSGGATNFLVKMTRWTVILFAGTCISLAYLSTRSGGSVTDKFVPAAAAPVETMGEAPANGVETSKDEAGVDETQTPQSKGETDEATKEQTQPQ